MLLFIQIIKIRKTFFKRLEEHRSSRVRRKLSHALRHNLVLQLQNIEVGPYVSISLHA